MAQSSKFARLDEDILLEFIYNDQTAPDLSKIENDDNGSQLKYVNTIAGDNTSPRMLIHELGSDVVNFTVNIANGYIYVNNFASRELLVKNGLTYKFDLNNVSIDNVNGFYIGGVRQTPINGIVSFSPNTNGNYAYTYANLAISAKMSNDPVYGEYFNAYGLNKELLNKFAGDLLTGGNIVVGERANSLYARPLQETGNTIRTAPGEGGRYYAVPTGNEGVLALLNNSLDYLDSNEWEGTQSSGVSVVSNTDVQAVWYDTVRLHLRTGYSFSGRGYEGFNFQIKARKEATDGYNYFTSLVYLNSSSFEIQNPKPFILSDSSFSKYIEIKIPSLVYMNDPSRNQEFNDSFFGTGQQTVDDTANYEIKLNLIETIKTVNGYEYIEVSDSKALTLSREDEFVDIAVTLQESNQGDYFEIYGTKDGSTAGFENYINGRLQSSGDDITVFYDVEVSEQLGLNYVSTYSTSFSQIANYDEPIIYRPVILNSAVSSNFLLTVNMRIYNETDNTQILKMASLVYNKPKKYGKRMSRINLSSNLNPTVVYNKLANTQVNRELNQFVNSIRPSIGETKYVSVALDTYGILAGSTNVTLEGTESLSTNEINYKTKGETEITLSKVSDNFIKFSIAKPKGDDIESISLVNADDIVLIIKSGSREQRVFHNPNFPDVDLGKGEVIFKVSKAVASRFDRKDTNISQDKFYINLKNGETESLLYFGKVNII